MAVCQQFNILTVYVTTANVTRLCYGYVVSLDVSEGVGKLDMSLVERDSVVVAVKNNMLNSTQNSKIALMHSFIKMGVPMSKSNTNDATILIFSKYTHARYCIKEINKNSAKTVFIEFDSFGSEYIGYIKTL